mmetsp:Transcript_1652/g.2158  ORF Transcript_1652/g.2158 Transcript_1652/m.2158 type:complete len:100 (-) Transcript_1652:314-613(-)
MTQSMVMMSHRSHHSTKSRRASGLFKLLEGKSGSGDPADKQSSSKGTKLFSPVFLDPCQTQKPNSRGQSSMLRNLTGFELASDDSDDEDFDRIQLVHPG